jgi:hypothetical protein
LDRNQYPDEQLCALDIPYQFDKGRKNVRSQKALKTASKNNVDLKLCIDRADEIVNHVLHSIAYELHWS